MPPRQSSRWSLVSILALSVLVGCGESGQPADAGQAQDALQTMLDAWKEGGSPTDLGKQTPPIQVKDLDWQGGFRLVSFTTGAEGKLVGYDMDYTVVLELKDPKGKAVRKTAVYTISTKPERLVVRQEG